MKRRNLIKLISLSLLLSLPVIASAQSGKEKAKSAPKKEQSSQEHRSQAEEPVDKLTAEQRKEMRKKAGAQTDANRDTSVGEDAAVKGSRDRYKGITDTASTEMEARSQSTAESAETKGNERAQEMRGRRDERKAIMEEEKSDRTVGQEADSPANSANDSDEVAEEDKEKPKKAWWKFWED